MAVKQFEKESKSKSVWLVVLCLITVASVVLFVLFRDEITLTEAPEDEEHAEIAVFTTETEREIKPHVITASTDDIIKGTTAELIEETEEEYTIIGDDREEESESVSTEMPIGPSVLLEAPTILQAPELPVGCEITALAILLSYYGFDIDKCTLARDYLPCSQGRYETRDGNVYKESFFKVFMGDPFERGYGCFSEPIVNAGEKYLDETGADYTICNISGCDTDTLYRYVYNGTPVIVWLTSGLIDPEYYETWYDIDTGEQLDWYLNEHCAVLIGFDDDYGTVTFSDPAKGIVSYEKSKFEKRFAEMHSQAIVMQKNIIEEENVTPSEIPVETESENEHGDEYEVISLE